MVHVDTGKAFCICRVKALLGFSDVHVTACAEGKPLPNELRKEEAQLRHEIELEDDNTAVPRTHIDDEYAHASEQDPKVHAA